MHWLLHMLYIAASRTHINKFILIVDIRA